MCVCVCVCVDVLSHIPSFRHFLKGALLKFNKEFAKYDILKVIYL